MKLADVIIFAPIAVALHVAAFASLPYRTQDGAGTMGQDAVSVKAAPENLFALVEAWDAAPDVVMTDMPAQPVVPTDAVPALPNTTDVQMQAPFAIAALTSITAKEALPLLPSPAPRSMQQVTAPQMLAPVTQEPLVPTTSAQQNTQRPEIEMPAPRPLGLPRAERSPDPTFDVVPPAVPPAAPHTTQDTAPPPKLRPKPRPTAAPATAQTAKGTSTAKPKVATAGTSNANTASVANDGIVKSALKEWSGRVRRAIESKKFYPNGARGSGVATITLTLSKSGTLTRAVVSKSSGDVLLDTAALSAVQRAKYPAAPKSVNQSSFTFQIPIRIQK